MENVSDVRKSESIRAFKSTISKCEKALAQMTRKRTSTTLLEKRLRVLRIGLAVLESTWNGITHGYDQEELADARHILVGIFPSMERIYARSKAGSPQRTLLEKRMAALRLSVTIIDATL